MVIAEKTVKEASLHTSITAIAHTSLRLFVLLAALAIAVAILFCLATAAPHFFEILASSELRNAFNGSMALALLASAIAIPLSLGCGFSAYIKKRSLAGRALLSAVMMIASIPSIVMGLLGFSLILLLRSTIAPQANSSLLLASATIACLISPQIILSTFSALDSHPKSLEHEASALGIPPLQATIYLLAKKAAPGIVSGCILGIARAIEDTAVIMLTGAVAMSGEPSLLRKFEALPFNIYYLSQEWRSSLDIEIACTSCLLLMAITLMLLCISKLLARKISIPRRAF